MELWYIVVDPYSQIFSYSGGYRGGATPLPIPNRAVKPSCADGTAGDTRWESRTLPDFLEAHPCGDELFLLLDSNS